MKEKNFSLSPIPKRIPEVQIPIDNLVGCIKGAAKMVFYNNNQICLVGLTKKEDGIGIDDPKIKDYKSLGLEKKNLSNGNLYLHTFGSYTLVGDTFIPKFTLLDSFQNIRLTLEFSDFSCQKIRSFTPSSIDKNVWYLSSDQ
ncbi:predicted protein [Naegleria gruberi]|uniref:Predicted protein n=1 Tax=Naegleria gruberi TaxID=5762 RepID=D2VIX3_NAEGR|nr:uncharacterized protein NAEGRDRAFT_68831 [Naegleria gruberi]EFC43176.1 predicted protein [Naegleria gruberi]|eukprot:XP_002675920.1 predicted protein [Naegleria gruberi strain NEG-M]